MKFLIVEDEPLIARRLQRMVEDLLPDEVFDVTVLHEWKRAYDFINSNTIDLCFLDLNLSGQNGFELISNGESKFDTIVTSAYTGKALEAFDHGVLDFVPKPFKQDRLKVALDRFFTKRNQDRETLLVQCGQSEKVIALEEIAFIKGAGNYSQVECVDGSQYLHSSSIGELSEQLIKNFERVHRSYLVPTSQIDSLHNYGAGKHELMLKSGKIVPVSRKVFAHLHDRLSGR